MLHIDEMGQTHTDTIIERARRYRPLKEYQSSKREKGLAEFSPASKVEDADELKRRAAESQEREQARLKAESAERLEEDLRKAYVCIEMGDAKNATELKSALNIPYPKARELLSILQDRNRIKNVGKGKQGPLVHWVPRFPPPSQIAGPQGAEKQIAEDRAEKDAEFEADLERAYHCIEVGLNGAGVNFKISPEAGSLLLDHHWPGNVRELKRTMELARDLNRHGTVTEEMIRDILADDPLCAVEV